MSTAKWQNNAGSKKIFKYEPKMSSASTVFSFEHTAQFITSFSMGFPNCLFSYFFKHTCAQKSLNWPLLPRKIESKTKNFVYNFFLKKKSDEQFLTYQLGPEIRHLPICLFGNSNKLSVLFCDLPNICCCKTAWCWNRIVHNTCLE